jgi:hypothetical protein
MISTWELFWTVCLIFCGGAFAVVTIIVAYAGISDVVDLIRGLKLERDSSIDH